MKGPTPEVAAGEILLAAEDVTLAFGGVKALTDVSFDIRKGEIRAIIGPDGGRRRHRADVPERGPVQEHDDARQHHGRAHAEDAERLCLAAPSLRPGDA